MVRRVFVILLLFVLGYVSFAYANGVLLATGSATVYKVTMSKFEADNGDGTTSVTAFEGTSTTLDIASAPDTNTSVGNFMSGLVVPDGSYSRVKPTPSGTFTIAGSVSYDGAASTYYTTSTAGPGGGCSTNTSGPAQECTININVGTQSWQTLPATIVVTDSRPNYRVRVKFNTSAALGLYEGPSGREIFPQQPSTSVQLIAQ